jgi:hypothetical protein
VQQHGDSRDQRPAQRVMLGGKIEGTAGQFGCPCRVGAGQGVGRLHQRRDGYLIARCSARGQLGGHLDRERTGGQQGRGDLAVEGLRGRGRLAGAYCLAVQVVAEAQLAAAFGEELGCEEFVDRVEQGRGGHVADRGELRDREAAAHGRSDRRNVAGCRRHSPQSPSHRLTHSPGKPPVCQGGVPRVDGDEVLGP